MLSHSLAYKYENSDDQKTTQTGGSRKKYSFAAESSSLQTLGS